MNENEIAKIVVDAAIHVHRELGPLLETVYEVVLAHELRKRGLRVERQVKIPIVYDGITFDEGYRADLLVEGTVLVEVKSVEALSSVHGKQVLTQLRLTKRKLGLLMNFGEYLLKNGIRRIVIQGPFPGMHDCDRTGGYSVSDRIAAHPPDRSRVGARAARRAATGFPPPFY